MRTSIKTLFTALALLIVSLVLYDTRLNGEYQKGNFRKPFGDFVAHNNSGFNTIELHSGTAINVEIVKGPYKVLVDPMADDFVRISQQGSKLILDAVFKDHYRSRASDYTVFVSCPNLAALNSDAYYEVNGRKWVDMAPNVFEKKPTLITGFNAENLTIAENNGSNIKLENDHLDHLSATTGIGSQTAGILTIGQGNTFKTTDFRILNKSILNIESAAGGQLQYEVADSAKLNVNGATIKQMFKTKQP